MDNISDISIQMKGGEYDIIKSYNYMHYLYKRLTYYFHIALLPKIDKKICDSISGTYIYVIVIM